MRDARNPAPCSIVDLSGLAMWCLKAFPGATQFLLLPDGARHEGIEDPAILAPDAPNYWDEAWRARV